MSQVLSEATAAVEQAPDRMRRMREAAADEERLVVEGVSGTARIRAVHDTGITVGTDARENPVADLELEVTVGSEPPTLVTSRVVIPRLSVGRLIPGSTLPVRVDALDRSKLAIDWDAPVDPDGRAV